jgi:hypothetical protein
MALVQWCSRLVFLQALPRPRTRQGLSRPPFRDLVRGLGILNIAMTHCRSSHPTVKEAGDGADEEHMPNPVPGTAASQALSFCSLAVWPGPCSSLGS